MKASFDSATESMFILKLVIDYSTYSHGKVYIFYVSVNRWLNTTYYIYCTYYVLIRSAYATLIVRFRLDFHGHLRDALMYCQ